MILDQFNSQIIEICRHLNVKYLYVFGSVITDQFKEDSDIDLLVNINSLDPFDYAENYFELKFRLEELLGRRIDLLEEKAINNKHLKFNIDKSKKLIYAA